MVEGMYVVVNIMLSLKSVMSPLPVLCDLSVVQLCTFFALGELGFLNCDVCMCVVNKQFELLEFVLITFLLTCSMMTCISLLLLGLCDCVTVGWMVTCVREGR